MSVVFLVEWILDPVFRNLFTGNDFSTPVFPGCLDRVDFLLQFQSDILGIPLSRPLCVETTAWGAASLAALAVGYYGDLSELRQVRRTDRCFVPEMSEEEREKRLAGWHKAVNRSREWING